MSLPGFRSTEYFRGFAFASQNVGCMHKKTGPRLTIIMCSTYFISMSFLSCLKWCRFTIFFSIFPYIWISII